jgi:hypothetical protein
VRSICRVQRGHLDPQVPWSSGDLGSRGTPVATKRTPQAFHARCSIESLSSQTHCNQSDSVSSQLSAIPPSLSRGPGRTVEASLSLPKVASTSIVEKNAMIPQDAWHALIHPVRINAPCVHPSSLHTVHSARRWHDGSCHERTELNNNRDGPWHFVLSNVPTASSR